MTFTDHQLTLILITLLATIGVLAICFIFWRNTIAKVLVRKYLEDRIGSNMFMVGQAMEDITKGQLCSLDEKGKIKRATPSDFEKYEQSTKS